MPPRQARCPSWWAVRRPHCRQWSRCSRWGGVGWGGGWACVCVCVVVGGGGCKDGWVQDALKHKPKPKHTHTHTRMHTHTHTQPPNPPTNTHTLPPNPKPSTPNPPPPDAPPPQAMGSSVTWCGDAGDAQAARLCTSLVMVRSGGGGLGVGGGCKYQPKLNQSQRKRECRQRR